MASDESQPTPPENGASAPATDDAAAGSFQRRLQGKPALIYGTLVAGALALLLLLMVVWLSTREGGSKVKLCLDTTVTDAQQAIVDGGVRRADVLIDAERPMDGLTAIQLQLDDGECRKLPEGADNRDALLQILGLISLYNQQGGGNVQVVYQRETIPPKLLMTSTPIPTATPPTAEASPTVASPVPVTPTVSPTREPSPTPSPSHTPQPTATARPALAPSATP